MLSALSFEICNNNGVVVGAYLKVPKLEEPEILRGIKSAIKRGPAVVGDLAQKFPDDSFMIDFLAHVISSKTVFEISNDIGWDEILGHSFSFRIK